MMLKSYLAILPLLFLSSFSLAQQQWEAQATEVSFTGQRTVGSFTRSLTQIIFDTNDLENSRFTATVDATSIQLSNKLQTRHAKGDNWMGVELFPAITFESSEIKRSGDVYQAIGKLSMHGVERDFVMPFTFKEDEGNGIFHSEFTIQRDNFDIGKKGGKYVTEVRVTVHVMARKI